MSKVINIGVIGCANIAKRSVIPAIKENKNFVLKGVASRSVEKADEFAKLFNTKPFRLSDSIKKAAEIFTLLSIYE